MESLTGFPESSTGLGQKKASDKNSPPGSFNSEFTLKIGQDTKRKGLSSNRQPSSFRGFA